LTVLKAQAVGSLIVTAATFGVALAVMYAIKAIGQLRVSAEGELHGLDLHEHGIPAYPEYLISPVGRPSGLVYDEPASSSTGPVVQLRTSETGP
jgi:Amt family ammonium transporter